MSIRPTLHTLKRRAMRLLNRQRVWQLRKLMQRSKRLNRIAFASIARQDLQAAHLLPDIEFVVYYGDKSAQSHFDMWDPVFATKQGRYCSVFREPEGWTNVSDRVDVYPVYGLSQLEPLFDRMPNLKAVFYIANNGTNMQAVRCGQYTHVFLGHGDSNKSSSANKMFRLYDEVWVAGQAHIDRFKLAPGNYDSLKIRVVGQPWMADWLAELPDYLDQSRGEWAYLPTWRGYYESTRYSSLDKAVEIISTAAAFARKGTVKLHPWTLPEDAAIIQSGSAGSNINVSDAATPMRDILARPLQFVICDLSAAVTEALVIGVPIFLFNSEVQSQPDPGFEATRKFCYIFNSAQDLQEQLNRVISNRDDPLAGERAKALTYYHDLSATRSGTFFEELDALANPVTRTEP